MFNNIPLELRLMKRWCFTGREKDLTMQKAPYMIVDGMMQPLSTVDDYHHCLTYFEIEPLLAMYPDRGLGYILVDGDGFTCIDLDVKEESPVSLTQRHWELVNSLSTYTECSQSGNGYHLWFKGEIEGAIKTTEIEVYSRERFIICTGNVVKDLPLVNDQSVIDFFNQHSGKKTEYEVLEDVEQKHSDEEIIAQAKAGDHTGKFEALFNGDWDAYVSILGGQRTDNLEFNPSDADAAFMTIVTFYTQNYEQCKRVWRASALADISKRYQGDQKEMRRKARNTGTEYKLNRAITLGLTRNKSDAEQRELEAKKGEEAARELIAKMQAEASEDGETEAIGDKELPKVEGDLEYPPGVMGELAKYFFQSSIKPIKEFAIAEAFAVAAGLFGRCYNISGTGLNIFTMMLAPSGTGKSALSKNPSAFMNYLQMRKGIPNAQQFITTQRFTHENAMFNEFKERSSFCQCLSEFGKQFRNMVTDNAGGAQTTVREQMTDIFSKSGYGDSAGGLRYSNSEKSVNLGYPVAFSFLGESVAEPFYEAVNYEMFADGFMSRFILMEYTGKIPYDNVNFDVVQPPNALVNKMAEAVIGVTRSLADINRVDVTPVGRDAEAGKWFQEYTEYCTDTANRYKDDAIWTSLWTRCNLKTMKIAALLAVMDNYSQPVITMTHVNWAYDYIMRHNNLVLRAVRERGLITDDHGRIDVLQDSLKEFFGKANLPENWYGIPNPSVMQFAGVIPWSYIQRKCGRNPAFNNHKYKSASQILRDTINDMVAMGSLRKISKEEAFNKYETTGECYQLSK